MKALGIDPGLRLTGYACVTSQGPRDVRLVEAGIIRLDKSGTMAQRLHQLYDDLREVIAELSPSVLVVEKLYAHYRHPRTAILMGHARGVILLCGAMQNIPVVDVPATEVKKAVTGHGHASKEQMQRAVQNLFRLDAPPSPPDVADAMGIAAAHVWRSHTLQ